MVLIDITNFSQKYNYAQTKPNILPKLAPIRLKITTFTRHFNYPYTMNRLITTILTLCVATTVALAQATNYKTETDIRYTQKTDAYSRQRLTLDIYHPESGGQMPVVVWFHSGGLETGNKEIPHQLREKGLVVVGVNYRQLPKVTARETIDDAAEAVAWVFNNIGSYGGNTRQIVVAGHSAGGYLSLMLCLDKKWLGRYGVDADSVMMYAPLSGQTITHFNVRKMQGIPPLRATIDELAPLYWVRADCPPIVLVCGDREQELFGRYDENQYFARMMKLVGHKQTYLYELDGYDHGDMIGPGLPVVLKHIRKMTAKQGE